MTSAWAKERNYYRCWSMCSSATKRTRATNGSYVRVEPVEAEVSGMIVERLIALKDDLARGHDTAKEPTIDFGAKRATLDKRRARSLEAHAEGLSTIVELRKALEKVDAERLNLEAQESRQTALQTPRDRREALGIVAALKARWRGAPTPVRREIARRLMTGCKMQAGESPEPMWRQPESLVTLHGFSGR